MTTAKNSIKEEKEEDTSSLSGKDNKRITVDKIKLELTHLNKIYWPDEKITKGEVVDYYNKIYRYIIPYLKNRPQSLRRTPNGIRDEGFFQKDMRETAPAWAETIPLYSESVQKDITYFLCNNKAALLYLANLGCIELNPWNSTVDSLDNPDYVILDLDPSDKNSFDQVVEIAIIIKSILDKIGAEGYCKTSGSSGLHIYLPLGRKYDYDQARMFAKFLAEMVADQAPELATIERSLKIRPEKIYIDYLQNKKGQTLASVYSLRPKPGATVSTPLLWEEVKPGLHPSMFTIKNFMKRIEEKGDLFRPVLEKGINMKKCLLKLEKM